MLNHTNAQKSLFKTPFINKSLTNKNLANKNLPGTQFAMHEVVGKRRANPKLVGEKIEIMTPAKRAAVAKSLSAKPEAASAKLWLHIHLPQLPLDILTRGGDESRASVLCEGNGTRRKILLANSAAVRLGVRKGMPLNAAHILGDVHIFEPNEVLEKKALRQLCHWALQFSPVISEVDNDGLLIEIKGSIKLFNGI